VNLGDCNAPHSTLRRLVVNDFLLLYLFCMNSHLDSLLPFDGRRRTWARGVYTKLAALIGKAGPTHAAPPATLPSPQLAELEESLRTHYFNRQPRGYLETERGLGDLANHLTNRLQNAQLQVVPWIESIRPLHGARVLEIGCGTGSSIVALAERGAHVTGVDLDEGALEVARKRCDLHAVVTELHLANATSVAELFGDIPFDLIIFSASLEHMVHEERLQAIADTWAMLRPGDLWCVLETPNRLWHTDMHTALLPFYHWLPDDLAFKYARFSERTNFRECYDKMTDERWLHFQRRGRGVSFHELHVALGALDAFEVVSYKNEFLADRGWLNQGTRSERYIALLSELDPNIHRAFLQEYLDLILRKPEPRSVEE
jgi:2-polyprenyl-3-methyl-5-hydroxy-6-metoxy-1,4-benzoquinol methylase